MARPRPRRRRHFQRPHLLANRQPPPLPWPRKTIRENRTAHVVPASAGKLAHSAETLHKRTGGRGPRSALQIMGATLLRTRPCRPRVLLRRHARTIHRVRLGVSAPPEIPATRRPH